ncbi:MAG TPA: hypothetical protein VG734_05190 [Lacunisphaera sp.]|nr:hypothetical protein [Lacunisphaera sp.]
MFRQPFTVEDRAIVGKKAKAERFIFKHTGTGLTWRLLATGCILDCRER